MKEMNKFKKLKIEPIKKIVITGLALGLSACSVGPDFVRPEAPKLSSFTREVEAASSKADEPLPDRIQADWWKDYQSASLNQVVELALKNNPTVEAALANLKVAKANVRAQQGFFFPSIGAGYSLSLIHI